VEAWRNVPARLAVGFYKKSLWLRMTARRRDLLEWARFDNGNRSFSVRAENYGDNTRQKTEAETRLKEKVSE
jgi:hypothetical protein